MKLNKLIIPILALSGLLLFLSLTDPRTLPLFALLIPFVLIGLASFYILFWVFKRFMGYQQRTSMIISTLVAAELTLMLLLSSLDQLEPGDFVIMILFGGLFVWYVARFKRN